MTGFNNSMTYGNAVVSTGECLVKAQRAVAGLEYRFLYDTNRLN